MTMIEPSRRSFIRGLISFTAAAPAIVRASSLMPVKALPPFDGFDLLHARLNEAYAITRERMAARLYGGFIDPNGTFAMPEWLSVAEFAERSQ